MAQGGGQYGGLADKWPVDAWKLSREEPNQQIASKLMKVVSAVTDMCTQLPFNVEKKDRTAERFATVSSRWAANALEGFPQDATPNLATFMARRRETFIEQRLNLAVKPLGFTLSLNIELVRSLKY